MSRIFLAFLYSFVSYPPDFISVRISFIPSWIAFISSSIRVNRSSRLLSLSGSIPLLVRSLPARGMADPPIHPLKFVSKTKATPVRYRSVFLQRQIDRRCRLRPVEFVLQRVA